MRTRTEPPTIDTMTAAETRANFADVVARVERGDARVLVEIGGTGVAAIVAARDLERLEELDRRRTSDFAVIDEIRAAFSNVPAEEIEREAAASIAEARSELHERHCAETR